MIARRSFRLLLGAIFAAHAMTAHADKVRVDIVEATVAQLEDAMAHGRITSRSLVARYLARIRRIDKAGPHLNSVIEVNPDALQVTVYVPIATQPSS